MDFKILIRFTFRPVSRSNDCVFPSCRRNRWSWRRSGSIQWWSYAGRQDRGRPPKCPSSSM